MPMGCPVSSGGFLLWGGGSFLVGVLFWLGWLLLSLERVVSSYMLYPLCALYLYCKTVSSLLLNYCHYQNFRLHRNRI